MLGIAGVEAQYYTADPNLHSHVTIAASAPAPDGKWRAINSGLIFSVQWIVPAAYQMCLGTELKARLSAAVGRPELTPRLGLEVNYRVDGHVPTAVVIAREERYDFLIYAESVLRRRPGKPKAARRRAAQARKEQARELGLN